MKIILFSMVAALLLVSGSASAQAIKKGDEARVPGHAWVTVMNPRPVSSVNRTLPYGDTCSIHRGGKVTVMALVNEGGQEQVLVRYTAQEVAGGALCPTDTLLFTTKQQFSTMTAAYNAAIEAEQQGRDRIQRILANEKK